MRRARLILHVCFLTTAARVLSAQWQATADAGVSHLRQAGIPESDAGTLGASLVMAGDRSTFRSSVLGAAAAGSGWTVQGLAAGSLLGPATQPVRWELGGVLSTFGESQELTTSSGELMARARFGRPGYGAAAGLGTGAVARGSSAQALLHGQADAWLSSGDELFLADASVVRTRAAFPGDTNSTPVHLSYADLSLSWRHDRGGLSVGATAGLRHGVAGIDGTRGWGSVEAVAWVSDREAFVLSGGTTLADAVRGVPATRYVSAAIRFAVRPHPSLIRRPTAIGGTLVAVEPLSTGAQQIEVRAAAASRVELMADFTDWTPEMLERAGNVWRMQRVISPGLHRIAIRIDGGEWMAPANLRQVTDDLGGVVGLITIP
jgi:hypothetical protein